MWNQRPQTVDNPHFLHALSRRKPTVVGTWGWPGDMDPPVGLV